MSQSERPRRVSIRHVVPLLPLFVLAPLAMAPRGCSYGMISGDCPLGADCGDNGSTGTAGGASAGAGGSSSAATCGGLRGLKCSGVDQYCDFAASAECGDGDQTGTCQVKPQACSELFAPVCGCDGKTYPNACFAASAGVSVAHTGTCADNDAGTGDDGGSDKSCGGLIGAGCDTGKFCDFPTGTKCGAADQTGVCTIIPQLCPDIVDPVCGCDGKTYNNECAAERASVSVASKGACSTSGAGAACGGLTGKACPKGEYCDFPIVTMCGSGDQNGTCAAIPEVCPDLFVPVCGCDGKTYGNACNAAQAAMSVKSPGSCSG